MTNSSKGKARSTISTLDREPPRTKSNHAQSTFLLPSYGLLVDPCYKNSTSSTSTRGLSTMSLVMPQPQTLPLKSKSVQKVEEDGIS